MMPAVHVRLLISLTSIPKRAHGTYIVGMSGLSNLAFSQQRKTDSQIFLPACFEQVNLAIRRNQRRFSFL